MSRLEGNPSYHPVITRFVERFQSRVSEIESLQQASNYSELALVAHWLKGAGGSVGFDVLTELGQQLEEAAKMSRGEDISELVSSLRGVAGRIVAPASQ